MYEYVRIKTCICMNVCRYLYISYIDMYIHKAFFNVNISKYIYIYVHLCISIDVCVYINIHHHIGAFLWDWTSQLLGKHDSNITTDLICINTFGYTANHAAPTM